jgi:hypothetical protein
MNNGREKSILKLEGPVPQPPMDVRALIMSADLGDTGSAETSLVQGCGCWNIPLARQCIPRGVYPGWHSQVAYPPESTQSPWSSQVTPSHEATRQVWVKGPGLPPVQPAGNDDTTVRVCVPLAGHVAGAQSL